MVNRLTISATMPDLRGKTSGIIAPGLLASPIVRQGLDYWLNLKGDRAYPARSEIVPRAIVRLLPNLSLIRLIDGGADYEFRIVGDAHTRAHRILSQGLGLRLSDVDKFIPGYGAGLKMVYDAAVRERGAIGFRGWFRRGEQKEKSFSESVLMPLGPDAATIDHVLTFSDYSPVEFRNG
jgi:hypothetical protein